MWNFNTDQIALAALLAAFWPIVDVPSPSRANAEELPSVSQVSRIDAPSASTSATTESRPCVLLRNDNVLFGVARQVGEYVIIETGQGGEIKLARQEVLCWSSSIRSLYRYRVDHRQQGDLSSLVQDARWCLRFDLYDLAAEEIRRIRSIDPRSTDAQRIEDQLRRQVNAASAVASETPATDTGPETASREGAAEMIKIVGYDDPSDPDDASDPDDVSDSDQEPSEESAAVHLPTLRRFASHVQPMLVNRCGRCHDASIHDPQGWTLVLPSAGTRASSRMTRDNLTSTLGYVDSESFEQSILLTKATSAHGGEEAPLDARSAKAIESLRVWLWMAANSMIPAPQDHSPHIASADRDPGFVTQTQPSAGLAPGQDDQSGFPPRTADNSRSGPSRLPQVANPFDPDLFNRRFQLDSDAAN